MSTDDQWIVIFKNSNSLNIVQCPRYNSVRCLDYHFYSVLTSTSAMIYSTIRYQVHHVTQSLTLIMNKNYYHYLCSKTNEKWTLIVAPRVKPRSTMMIRRKSDRRWSRHNVRYFFHGGWTVSNYRGYHKRS